MRKFQHISFKTKTLSVIFYRTQRSTYSASYVFQWWGLPDKDLMVLRIRM